MVKVPFLSEGYINMREKFEIMGGVMGYFMPSDGEVETFLSHGKGKLILPCFSHIFSPEVFKN